MAKQGISAQHLLIIKSNEHEARPIRNLSVPRNKREVPPTIDPLEHRHTPIDIRTRDEVLVTSIFDAPEGGWGSDRQITAAGRKVFAKFASARDAAEATALDGVGPEQRAVLFELLGRIADRQDAPQPFA